jgi:hypothetical protein
MIAGLDRHDWSSAGFQPAFNKIAGKMPALRFRRRETAAQDVVCRYETTSAKVSTRESIADGVTVVLILLAAALLHPIIAPMHSPEKPALWAGE